MNRSITTSWAREAVDSELIEVIDDPETTPTGRDIARNEAQTRMYFHELATPGHVTNKSLVLLLRETQDLDSERRATVQQLVVNELHDRGETQSYIAHVLREGDD
jgi:hypothetical protein